MRYRRLNDEAENPICFCADLGVKVNLAILPNADHYVFLSNEQEVEKDIKAFLATLNPEGN